PKEFIGTPASVLKPGLMQAAASEEKIAKAKTKNAEEITIFLKVKFPATIKFILLLYLEEIKVFA
ncbi:hypothetical protein J4447_05205, partial [Candidatus Pacearchaeota archaeon]|nr:hypothetical protein [Candidatus Pacearchaeota archaeon]